MWPSKWSINGNRDQMQGLESVVEMICGGLLGGASSSCQLNFGFQVSNSTDIGLVYRGIANGITYPRL
jgi:hypothetical protein